MSKSKPQQQIQVPIPPHTDIQTKGYIDMPQTDVKKIMAWYCQIYGMNVNDSDVSIQYVNNQYVVRVQFNEQYTAPKPEAKPPVDPTKPAAASTVDIDIS